VQVVGGSNLLAPTNKTNEKAMAAQGRGDCFQGQDCLTNCLQTTITNSSHARALREYLVRYHAEQNHQGKENVQLFPAATKAMIRVDGSVGCKERLGGLLKCYHREAA